ncbi:MAG: RNA-guided pseudouridylation complex pseudouridine synthase subunit Cbf5 [Candidatus Micrarchaeota archaeon]
MSELQHAKSSLGIPPESRSLEERLKYGIVVVDKPEGPSSHEVSAFVRKILHIGVTGHTGTLDQNVSGVLVVLLEHSRKVVNFIPNTDKTYVCLMKISGKRNREELESAFSNFRGEIYQRPPLQSAVAKKLRTRKVHSLEILEVRENLVLFECKCEAGTYIRKIVSDAAEVLGVKAEMAELRRTQAGDFSEKDAISLQALSDYYFLWKEKGQESYLKNAIKPIESLKIPRMVLSDGAAKKIRHGVKPRVSEVVSLDGNISRFGKIGLFTHSGELIAMGEALLSSSEIKSNAEADQFDEPVCRISRVIHEF